MFRSVQVQYRGTPRDRPRAYEYRLARRRPPLILLNFHLNSLTTTTVKHQRGNGLNVVEIAGVGRHRHG